jgi:putative peptidoglycan lipid II flippase
MVVNLVGNLVLIVPLQHMGPPLATAIASTVNVAMLYRTLRLRGHFTPDARLRHRAPRLALAALAMGAVLWAGQGLLMPYVHGGWALRIGALAVLVSAGVVVYGIATLVMGAFTRADIALLTRRRPAAPTPNPSNNT